MNTTKTKITELKALILKDNKERLAALIRKGGGAKGYWYDIGGDERGCFGGKLGIVLKDNSIIAVHQQSGFDEFIMVRAEFDGFVKRYHRLIGKKIDYRPYHVFVDFSERTMFVS